MELPQNGEITDKFEQLVQMIGEQCEDSDRKHKETQEMFEESDKKHKETQEMLVKVYELLQNLHVKQPNEE